MTPTFHCWTRDIWPRWYHTCYLLVCDGHQQLLPKVQDTWDCIKDELEDVCQTCLIGYLVRTGFGE